jgi:protein phosphatase
MNIPDLSLVVLVGPSSAGKSSFAARHFRPTEVLSSDFCRGLVADDVNSNAATPDAFEVLHFIAAKRLAAGRLTVVDATSLKPEDRRPLVELARRAHCLPVAITFDLPEALLQERNAARPDRDIPRAVIHRQRELFRRNLRGLEKEGFRVVHHLRSVEEIDAATVVREPLFCDRRDETGPFDLIGDVHGCAGELAELLTTLGYEVAPDRASAVHPEGRRVVFLGDLVDRGPDTPGVLRLVMGMHEAGTALVVPGNHDDKLKRALRGRKVKVAHGLAESLEQLAAEPPELRERIVAFVDGLASHLVLDGGKLVCAHAGMREDLAGRASRRVREFALYGETTGETDEFGLPVRYDWARDYRGRATVVYGHTPVPEATWVNNTICLDTGVVFGGKLTAMRWPERELVSVPAEKVWYEPAKPFLPSHARGGHDELLDLDDVLGKRIVHTALLGDVTIKEDQAAAALEVMSRFAVDPRWLVYLPATMAPAATSALPDLLEHPAEAFAAYRSEGIGQVVVEAKHMGSRAVVIVCRDEATAAERFAIDDGAGVIFTRTGRRFLNDRADEADLLGRVRAAMDAAGLWDELGTGWAVLDCELLPWSAKAGELLERQYAAAGSAGSEGLAAAVDALTLASAREGGHDLAELLARFSGRAADLDRFTEAYGRYCWPVSGPGDLRLAPFMLLASEGAVHDGKPHAWHMEQAARLAAAGDGVVIATPWRAVDLTDPESEAAATGWWRELVDTGGEGMVVKPADPGARNARGRPAQPGLKVRGPEYLRIVYGPEYLRPEHLQRLRRRSLGLKRSLAQREHALGFEALHRFVRGEPLHRVHECVFAVLAMESEPVDPRL